MKETEIELCPNETAIMVHTKFNIQENPALKIIIENITGVENLETWSCHKYNFLVVIGKAFDREEIASMIEKKIKEFRED